MRLIGEDELTVLDPYGSDNRLNSMRSLDLGHQRRRLVDNAARRYQGKVLCDDVGETGIFLFGTG